MPITQAIRTNYAVLGIDSNDSSAFNFRSVLATVIFCLCVFTTSAFLFNQAETFGEYMDSVYITSATVIDTFTYFSFLWRLSKFSTFVNSLEETFTESE